MELKKVFLATMGIAMSVCAANAQTPITENSYYVANLHSANFSVKYHQINSGGQKEQDSPNYFIHCIDSNLGAYTTVFEVTQSGRIGGTGLWLNKTSSSHSMCPHFSINWDNNNNLTFSTNSYMNSYYPAIFKFTKATFDNDVIVNGKLTCKDELNVTEVNSKSIRTEDITVDMNNAADYVFDENYNLRSLSDVESFVKENKHLPGVPSAAEMAEKGMSVSQMSNLLLEKVEELTLHMIELEKENKALKAEMESLKK